MGCLLAVNSHADAEQARVKALMHSFLGELSKMNPYLASEAAFSSKEGRAAVGASLKVLSREVQEPPVELKKSTGFRITFGLLADHITKTEKVFERGELEHARMSLNGMTNLCASCHTQTPRVADFSNFLSTVKPGVKPTFESSNFLFVTRRYDEALAGFDALVRGYPKSGLSEVQLPELYRRKLAIFARVRRDPKGAIQNFKEDLKNPLLPVNIKQSATEWIANFSLWKDEKQDPARLSNQELIDFVAKKIPPLLDRKMSAGDPELMNLMRLSGLLYERLYLEKDPAITQQLLYYLAMCERSLAPLNWYSLNEIYLKECVVRFPKGPFSKKCFEAYRSGMAERYKGRSLPEFVKGSIDALQDYL